MANLEQTTTNTSSSVDYDIRKSRYGRVVCYNDSNIPTLHNYKGWQSAATISAVLPYLITQLFVANLAYRAFYYLTRPLYIPPFVAQILTGLLFSPTILGENAFVLANVFPLRFTMVMETFANLALVYNIFLLGLGMDLRIIKMKDPKPVIIAFVGILVAIPAAGAFYYLPGNGFSDKILAGCIYWAVAFGCTNFPDLARILADLKLLRSDMGRTAMGAAIITDLCTWAFLIICVACFGKAGEQRGGVGYSLPLTILFVLLCFFVVRPGVAWACNNTVQGGHVTESHVWFIFSGVVLCAFITEAIGLQSITGAFFFGLCIPHDNIIRSKVEEKLHDFLSGILMPLFYIICGSRADIGYLFTTISVGMVVFVILSSILVKIVSTVICSFFLRMPLRDGFAVGALMNTKGTMALVILNTGRDTKALDVVMYTQLTLAFLAMSIVVEPLLAFTYTPKKKIVYYKNRTVQKVKGEKEFRVLACVHVLPNVSGITNLLQVSNPTKQSPLNVFAVHLVELTDRTTASLLIMNDEAKPKADFSDRVRAESEQITEAFEAMEVNNDVIMVQTITAVSPYETMHEDICGLAGDKHTSLIILPYHKKLTPEGRLDEGNDMHADINHKVWNNAPCSVGILVDRGMTVFRSEISSFKGEATKREVAMLFLGGRDDREALAYAWRMAGQEMVNLTVMRFVPSREALNSAGKLAVDEYEKEKKADEECIYEFNFKTMQNDLSVSYVEKVVNDGQETIAAIREMENNNSYDLYIVGRGYNVESPATIGLSDWSTTPDLGTIGDTLTVSNFTMQASVLVIQQYSSTNRKTAANNQEHVEAKPFMAEEDDEVEKYHIGMRK